MDVRRDIELVLLRRVLNLERVLRGSRCVVTHIGQLHQIILRPVLLSLFHHESRLAKFRALGVAGVVLPPLLVVLVAELGELLAVDADDDCPVLLREVLNVGVLPRLIDVSLYLACNALGLVSLPQEGTLAVYKPILCVL